MPKDTLPTDLSFITNSRIRQIAQEAIDMLQNAQQIVATVLKCVAEEASLQEKSAPQPVDTQPQWQDLIQRVLVPLPYVSEDTRSCEERFEEAWNTPSTDRKADLPADH